MQRRNFLSGWALDDVAGGAARDVLWFPYLERGENWGQGFKSSTSPPTNMTGSTG